MVHLGATNSISLVSLAGPSFETKGKKLLLSMQFQIVVWLEYYTKLSLNIYLKNSFVPSNYACAEKHTNGDNNYKNYCQTIQETNPHHPVTCTHVSQYSDVLAGLLTECSQCCVNIFLFRHTSNKQQN